MEVVLDNTEHDSSLVKTFASYFEKEDYLDVTFACKGGRQVRAHKLVLSSVSPFLKQIFSEWKDSQDMVTILVPDIDHNILKLLLDFMYEGTMKLSKTELNEFKIVQRMLGIRFPGAVINECRVQKLPQSRPPPLLKLDNNFHYGPQRKLVPQNNNYVMERQKPETVAITNDSCVPKINARQPSNPVDEPRTADRRSRDLDDDPLNVPDYYFVPTTTSRSTSQAEGANINGNGGIVPSEGERHSHLDTASSSSLMSQQGTEPVNNHPGACGSNLRQRSGSSVQKRPYTQIGSDIEHFGDVSSAVNLEQTKGRRTRNRKKGVGLIDQSANTAMDTESTQSRQTKSRKT